MPRELARAEPRVSGMQAQPLPDRARWSEVALCLAIAAYLFVALTVASELLIIPSLAAFAAAAVGGVWELTGERRPAQNRADPGTKARITGGSAQ